jgi:hypothetical protein
MQIVVNVQGMLTGLVKGLDLRNLEPAEDVGRNAVIR